MNQKFQVGDRVHCIAEYMDRYEAVGKNGTVRLASSFMIAVEFDEHINGHELRGECKDGYGWDFDPETASSFLVAIPDESFEADNEAWDKFISEFVRN